MCVCRETAPSQIFVKLLINDYKFIHLHTFGYIYERQVNVSIYIFGEGEGVVVGTGLLPCGMHICTHGIFCAYISSAYILS